MEISASSPRDLGTELQRAISRAKRGDELSPVRVVMPSSLAAQALGRALGRSGGVLNVRFVTLTRLAEEILTPQVALGLPRLDRPTSRELVRRIAGSARSPLASSSASSLVPALGGAFSELRRWSALQLEGLEDEGPLQREIVRLYREFLERSKGLLDSQSLLELAADGRCAAIPPVVAVVTEPPTVAESALLNALDRAHKLQLVWLRSGDVHSDSTMRAWFGEPGNLPHDFPATAEQIVVSPDAETEIHLAVEALLDRADRGIPFSRMALLYSSSSPYRLLAFESLRTAGIPVRGRGPERLAGTARGRFTLGLLATAAEGFSRRSVLDWLAASPVIDPHTGGPVPIDRWRDIAQRAAIPDGDPCWEERLLHYAQALGAEDTLASYEEAMSVQQLRRFLGGLRQLDFSGTKTWQEWVFLTGSAMSVYFDEGHGAGHAREISDFDCCLKGLIALDSLGDKVDASAFADALSAELSETPIEKSDPHGVFVGRFSDAAACDFDLVVLCGLSEGQLPATRARGQGGFAPLLAPGLERSAEGERRSFLLALASGSEAILSSSRGDTRSQRERLPSPWLVEQAARLANRPLRVEDLFCEAQEWPWLRVVPSFASAVTAARIPVTSVHSRMQDLAASMRELGPSASLVVTDEVLRRGFRMIESERSNVPDEYDGVVGERSELSIGERDVMSPTALEDWAVCPFRYFLKHVLRLGDSGCDSDDLGLASSERGKLVHAALERFLLRVPSRTSSGQGWSDEERRLLTDIGRELYSELRSQGKASGGVLARVELSKLDEALLAVLDEDECLRRDLGTLPGALGVEVVFGQDGVPPVEIPRPAGKAVRFRGRIDRIDRSASGKRAIAFDYKTGKVRADHRAVGKADPVAGGKKLQLGIYALHTEAVAGDEARVGAQYWFTGAKQERHGFELNDVSKKRVREVVNAMADGIEAGVFPLSPGQPDRESFENCRSCPYDRVCPVDRGEMHTRKSGHVRLLPFQRLTGGLESAEEC